MASYFPSTFLEDEDDGLMFCGAPRAAPSLDASASNGTYFDPDSLFPCNPCGHSAKQFLLTDDLPSPVLGGADKAAAAAAAAAAIAAGIAVAAPLASPALLGHEPAGPSPAPAGGGCGAGPAPASAVLPLAAAPQLLQAALPAAPQAGPQRRQLYSLVLVDGGTGRPLRRATEGDAWRAARLIEGDLAARGGGGNCGGAPAAAAAIASSALSAAAAAPQPGGGGKPLPRALSFVSDGAAAAAATRDDDDGEEVQAFGSGRDQQGGSRRGGGGSAGSKAGSGNAPTVSAAAPGGHSSLERPVAPRQAATKPAAEKRVGPCMHCGVKESPQWRKGPASKSVLCNACGTRWRRTSSLGPPIPSAVRAAAAAEAAAAAAKRKATASPGGGASSSKGAVKAAAR